MNTRNLACNFHIKCYHNVNQSIHLYICICINEPINVNCLYLNQPININCTYLNQPIRFLHLTPSVLLLLSSVVLTALSCGLWTHWRACTTSCGRITNGRLSRSSSSWLWWPSSSSSSTICREQSQTRFSMFSNSTFNKANKMSQNSLQPGQIYMRFGLLTKLLIICVRSGCIINCAVDWSNDYLHNDGSMNDQRIQTGLNLII